MPGVFRCRELLAKGCRAPAWEVRRFAASKRTHFRHPNVELIHRFYDDLWNKFDQSVSAEILDENLEFRGSLGQVRSFPCLVWLSDFLA